MCLAVFTTTTKNSILSSITYSFPLPEKGQNYTAKYFPYSIDFLSVSENSCHKNHIYFCFPCALTLCEIFYFFLDLGALKTVIPSCLALLSPHPEIGPVASAITVSFLKTKTTQNTYIYIFIFLGKPYPIC